MVVGCSVPSPECLSTKTCQGTFQVHSEHSCMMFGEPENDEYAKINIPQMLQTILVLLPNPSKSCPLLRLFSVLGLLKILKGRVPEND